MPLSDAARERCRPFLAPGERIRYMFPARSVTIGRALGAAPFIVVVTDTEVLVLACGWRRRDDPKSVWARYPGATRLGPVEQWGSVLPTITLGELVLEFDEEYAAVVAAADAERSGPGALPEDPFPDL